MNELLLEVFLRLVGVGAASGLVMQDSNLFIVSDNSNYLYSYSLEQEQLHKQLLWDSKGNNDQVRKSEKLDLESVFLEGDTLYLFGSGSKPNRHHLFRVDVEQTADFEHQRLDLQAAKLQSELALAEEDYNIEGSFIYDGDYYFFNRGNGPGQRNGVMVVDTAFAKAARFVPVPLPWEGEGIPGFTDALRLGDRVYFLAAIEHSGSTYHDGKIGGSFLGVLDLESLALESFTLISDRHKFEGLTRFAESDDALTFLLCEDPDDGSMESIIYRLQVAK